MSAKDMRDLCDVLQARWDALSDGGDLPPLEFAPKEAAALVSGIVLAYEAMRPRLVDEAIHQIPGAILRSAVAVTPSPPPSSPLDVPRRAPLRSGGGSPLPNLKPSILERVRAAIDAALKWNPNK